MANKAVTLSDCHAVQQPLRQVTLAVLAGGVGARMGFKPKGELLIDGRPILAHLLDAAAWSGPRQLITAPGRQHPPGWELFDCEVIDPVAGQGPLRGILTALESAETDIVLATTVDMPAIGRLHLRWLMQQLLERPEVLAIMLYRGVPDAIEPFPCALRRTLAGPVRTQLAAGRRAVQGLLQVNGVLLLQAPAEWNPRSWSNLNYPADVAAYCASPASLVQEPGYLQPQAGPGLPCPEVISRHRRQGTLP